MGLFNRSNKVAIGGQYFNTHSAIKGYYKNARFVMDDTGVDFYDYKTLLHHFNWDEIVGYENDQDVQREGRQRLTATRMVTLGVFSLATPKATGKLENRFTCTLHTTTGDVELENNFEGSAGSSMVNLAVDTLKKNSEKVRAFVATRATAQK